MHQAVCSVSRDATGFGMGRCESAHTARGPPRIAVDKVSGASELHPPCIHPEGVMAVFPKAEAKILAVARLVIEGLRAAPEDFPTPPVSADELEAMTDACDADATKAAAAKAAYHEAHVRKDKAFARLTPAVKAVLAYAKILARRQPAKLIRLGWGPRRERKPLEAPGEVRDLKIEAEGETYLILSWKRPVDGGAAAAYTIQVKRGGGLWEDLAARTDTRCIVSDQPRGVELEYRVFARNKAGVGSPSATVRAVL